jgi:hypothetical protein
MVAGISAALAVPRAVPPAEIPDPLVEPRALEEAARGDRALATAADREGLDADVRFLGEALRAFGRAEAEGDTERAIAERRSVALAAQRAAAQGEIALAKLRAYQIRSFLRELQRWERTGRETDELRELGGHFVEEAGREGWIDHGRLLPDETVRAVLYKRRWADLTLSSGAGGAALDLLPVEKLALARFLLLHPHREPGPPEGADRRLHGVVLRSSDDDEKRYEVRKIDEVYALDPAYPADLAKGVVYFRHHSYALAAKYFTAHLEAHPSGAYNVRAQNYLLAALQAATTEAP